MARDPEDSIDSRTSIVIGVATAALTAWVVAQLSSLPNTVATHFGPSLEANGHAPKTALLGPALLQLILVIPTRSWVRMQERWGAVNPISVRGRVTAAALLTAVCVVLVNANRGSSAESVTAATIIGPFVLAGAVFVGFTMSQRGIWRRGKSS